MIELAGVLFLVVVMYFVIRMFPSWRCVKPVKSLPQRDGGVIVEKSTEEYKLKLTSYMDYICGNCKELIDSTHPSLTIGMGFKECKKYNCMIRFGGKYTGHIKCGTCFKERYDIEKIYLKQDI